MISGEGYSPSSNEVFLGGAAVWESVLSAYCAMYSRCSRSDMVCSSSGSGGFTRLIASGEILLAFSTSSGVIGCLGKKRETQWINDQQILHQGGWTLWIVMTRPIFLPFWRLPSFVSVLSQFLGVYFFICLFFLWALHSCQIANHKKQVALRTNLSLIYIERPFSDV